MSMPQFRNLRAAKASYGHADTACRISGASSHELIQILFDEAILAIDALPATLQNNRLAQFASHKTRALTILHALEASLNFDVGGELPHQLAACYRATRALINDASKTRNVAKFGEATTILRDLATAWQAIR